MTTWYIWPVNGHSMTHGYLALVVGAQNEQKNKLCADGKRKNLSRDLFRCPNGYKEVRTAITAIAAHGLKFEVYREEVESKIIRFKAWEKRLRRKANLY